MTGRYVSSQGSGKLLHLDEVTFAYGRRPALLGIDLTISEGQFAGIVGPSGSGKTTLLRLLTGSIGPTMGSVHRARGVRIGYVPQVDTVDWSFPVTVAECVLMGRTNGRRVPWPSRAERRGANEVLERLGIDALAGRHIRELSGGQQQRMFLARALLADPHLVLLDEPTSGVDVATRHEILHLLADLHQHGLTIVLTTHDLNGMASHLPHLVCLNTTVVAEGAPHEVLRADVLERTFGARLEILEHAGLRLVVDHLHNHPHVDTGELADAKVIPLSRGVG